MNLVMLVIAFILGAIMMFVVFCMGYTAKIEELVSKVRFYVARDKDGALWLYLSKPTRYGSDFIACMEKGGKYLGHDSGLRMYGLNENDYKDLKWEDEPIEVFVTMED